MVAEICPPISRPAVRYYMQARDSPLRHRATTPCLRALQPVQILVPASVALTDPALPEILRHVCPRQCRPTAPSAQAPASQTQLLALCLVAFPNQIRSRRLPNPDNTCNYVILSLCNPAICN